MKTFKMLILIGVGFLLMQSCSRKSHQEQVCECLDMATKMMKGDREHNSDGTFPQKYIQEHVEENKRCDELANGVTDKAGEEKVVREMEKCPGYAAYEKELTGESE